MYFFVFNDHVRFCSICETTFMPAYTPLERFVFKRGDYAWIPLHLQAAKTLVLTSACIGATVTEGGTTALPAASYLDLDSLCLRCVHVAFPVCDERLWFDPHPRNLFSHHYASSGYQWFYCFGFCFQLFCRTDSNAVCQGYSWSTSSAYRVPLTSSLVAFGLFHRCFNTWQPTTSGGTALFSLCVPRP
jgi:hypothetical protein